MGEKFKVRVNIEVVYEIELPDCIGDPLFIEFWKKKFGILRVLKT